MLVLLPQIPQFGLDLTHNLLHCNQIVYNVTYNVTIMDQGTCLVPNIRFILDEGNSSVTHVTF